MYELAAEKRIPHSMGTWRQGDPATLLADATKAQAVLVWTPLHTRLEEIVASAWAWERKTGE